MQLKTNSWLPISLCKKIHPVAQLAFNAMNNFTLLKINSLLIIILETIKCSLWWFNSSFSVKNFKSQLSFEIQLFFTSIREKFLFNFWFMNFLLMDTQVNWQFKFDNTVYVDGSSLECCVSYWWWNGLFLTTLEHNLHLMNFIACALDLWQSRTGADTNCNSHLLHPCTKPLSVISFLMNSISSLWMSETWSVKLLKNSYLK